MSICFRSDGRTGRALSRRSFRHLVDAMDRHYSFFALKGIDWTELSGRYRRAVGMASDVETFVAAISPMLAELKDSHVWIESPGRSSGGLKRAGDTKSMKQRRIAPSRNLRRDVGYTARTPEGFGYAAIYTLVANKSAERRLRSSIAGLFDAPGIIMDLRRNNGGSEPMAARIASMFADRPRVYAFSMYRAGPRHDDFGEARPRILRPRRGRRYTRPIVCLIGPGCVSSGEGLVQMLRVLPHVTLVGRPTRGASGNPAPVQLPNGVRVWFSRWLDLLPDGTLLEGRGVRPDIVVECRGSRDQLFRMAIRVLQGASQFFAG